MHLALVLGSGISGAIYVVCPAMIGEFAPPSQRGAVISLHGAIYTLAGIAAPFVTGSIIDNATIPIEGFMAGFNQYSHPDSFRNAWPFAVMARRREGTCVARCDLMLAESP